MRTLIILTFLALTAASAFASEDQSANCVSGFNSGRFTHEVATDNPVKTESSRPSTVGK